MQLRRLSDDELLKSTRRAVDLETAATTNVVRHFREIHDRGLHLERAHGSIFVMAVKDFGYDKSKAQRRVNAMMLSFAVPEILEKIDRGELCLQSAADIQTFLNRERGLKKPYCVQQTRELIEVCSNLSTRDVQLELASRNPTIDFIESKRYVAKDRLSVTHTISTATEEKLERIKQLRSHVNPFMTREDLLDFMAEVTLDAIDPARRDERVEKRQNERAEEAAAAQKIAVAQKTDAVQKIAYKEEVVSQFGEIQLAAILTDEGESVSASAGAFQESSAPKSSTLAPTAPEFSAQRVQPARKIPPKRSRYITATDSRLARKQNTARGCEYVDEKTGRCCGSTHQLERDHVIPFSHGGSNGAENIRLLCAQHNRWRSRSFVRAVELAYG